jgi:hypothetical protein
MVFTPADFAAPKREDHDDAEVFIRKIPASTPNSVEERGETAPRNHQAAPESFKMRRDFMDHEYPDWVDDLPPWRNPDQKGETYLYVWQQHTARIRGHH